MADFGIRPDDPAFSPYLCRFCVLDAARLFGCLDPLQSDALRTALDELGKEVAELKQQLLWEREHKQISLEDAHALISAKLVTPSSSPTFEGPTLEEWRKRAREESGRIKQIMKETRQCEAVKPNGKRCQAFALTDQSLCVFHDKQAKKEARRLAREQVEA